MEYIDRSQSPFARFNRSPNSVHEPVFNWASTGPGHAVQFYANDDYLRDAVVHFFSDGLQSGQSLISIATAQHAELFAEGLSAAGFDVKNLESSGRLILVDARDLLDRLLHGNRPDPSRFRTVVGGLLDRAGGRWRVVRAYGEMVDVLWRDGNTPAALRLEQLWNVLGMTYHFALLCSYSVDNFTSGSHASTFEDICGQHQRVLPTQRRGPAR